MNYYDKNYKAFIENTKDVDMSDIIHRFLSHLQGKRILDVGCGSGRDLKTFRELGYDVLGIDSSERMVETAKKHSQVQVLKSTIEEFKTNNLFDGVWACASLLHLNDEELVKAFHVLGSVTNSHGVIYCSFKHGSFQGKRNGRFFNDKTLDTIKPYINNFKLLEHWISVDSRPGREEEWLNLIVQK